MRTLALTLALAACQQHGHVPTGDDSIDTPDAPSEVVPDQPATCLATFSMAGVDPPAKQTLDTVTIDKAGIAICLHLDATQNIVRAFFDASTDRFGGAVTPFGSVLREGGVPIASGGDVAFGTPATSFHSIGLDMPKGQVRDVVFHIFAHDATATSTITLTMLEPFE
jgi:hypothetical protein